MEHIHEYIYMERQADYTASKDTKDVKYAIHTGQD
jgi:hypothetical protein